MNSIEEIKRDIQSKEDDIEEAKNTKAQAEGSNKTYLKQLKESYDLSSIEEIESFISDAEKELSEIEGNIIKMHEKLKNEYDRINN